LLPSGLIMAKRVVIVGGGISGLAAAHRLVELGVERTQITLLEASGRLGGTLQTEHRDGFLLERGPDSFISEKPEAVALAKRLGLESRLIQTNEQFRRSFIVRNGRLRPVPEGFQLLAPSRMWPFITTDIFSVAGKLRMAAELLLPRRNGNSDESLASFVRRRLGQEALERMAQPMVGGIYTADPETLSLRATLPRFLDMERDHRSLILAMRRQGRAQKSGTSGARYSLFLSFDRGMEVLIDALGGVVPNVRLKTRIEALSFNSRTWRMSTDSGAMIIDNDFHAFDEPSQRWINEYSARARPIVIGRNVFIGARAIILKGVTIGDRAVIGAGAVVTQDIPSCSVAAGNPAKVTAQKVIS